MTIQFDLEKVSKFFQEHGLNFADYPDFAAQMMILNERLMSLNFDKELFFDLTAKLLTEKKDDE